MNKFQCVPSVRKKLMSHEGIAPGRAFDNILVLGTEGTWCFVLETSAGLILIDALWPGQACIDIIESGLRAFGHEPDEIKALLITHGHLDHTGCGGHFVKHYGVVPYMSKRDYDFICQTTQDAAEPEKRMDYEVTHFLNDGDAFTLGDTTVEVFSTPGHTPGGLSFIVPAIDQGERHLAMMWGGTNPPVDPQLLAAYFRSLDTFEAACAARGVDAILSNHPFYDNGVEKLALMRNRLEHVQNPFITGGIGVKKQLQLFRECCIGAIDGTPGSCWAYPLAEG